MDFSVILQQPEIRALVQEKMLERAFHDALFPRLLFRSEATPQLWPANVGDTMVFSGVGLMTPSLAPLKPGVDPLPSSYQAEQWAATLQQYAGTKDVHMPTSVVAIANLFLRDAQQLGLQAGQTMNRLVRNRLYAAALSGMTVCDGPSGGAVSTFRVKRLNGFTRARRPDLLAGSPVMFDQVSTNNPLKVHIIVVGPSTVAREVIGYTPDTAGDEVGPGTLTIQGGTVNVLDRAMVQADDATYLYRVGGGDTVDAISTADVLKLEGIRVAIAHLRTQNVPEMPDGRYHCHFDPLSEAEIFGDTEWQRLHHSIPDYYTYKQFVISEILGTLFLRNTESPLKDTVEPRDGSYSQLDPFPGEVLNASSVQIHRPLFLGQGSIYEYYQDLGMLITEAGIAGRIGEPRITNSSIEVLTERIQLIIRQPLNRLADMPAITWKFIGDWPVRTDATTGDSSRYKRMTSIEHG